MIAFIQRIYSRLTGVPSSAIRMEFDRGIVLYPDDTGDYGELPVHPVTHIKASQDLPPRRRRGRVDEDAATGREAQEEDY